MMKGVFYKLMSKLSNKTTKVTYLSMSLITVEAIVIESPTNTLMLVLDEEGKKDSVIMYSKQDIAYLVENQVYKNVRRILKESGLRLRALNAGR